MPLFNNITRNLRNLEIKLSKIDMSTAVKFLYLYKTSQNTIDRKQEICCSKISVRTSFSISINYVVLNVVRIFVLSFKSYNLCEIVNDHNSYTVI